MQHHPKPVPVKGYAQSPGISNPLSHWQGSASNQNHPHSAEYMPSHAKHSHPVMRCTNNIPPTVDKCQDYQSQIIVHNTSQWFVAYLPFYLLKFYILVFIILWAPFHLQIYLCLCFKILWYKFSSKIYVYKEYLWPTIQTSFHLLYFMLWNCLWLNSQPYSSLLLTTNSANFVKSLTVNHSTL